MTNQIKEGTEFTHKGGGKYRLLTILHPSSDMPKSTPNSTQTIFHTELEKEITMSNYVIDGTLISFSEVDEYLVLYMSLAEQKQEVLWARPMQMFFEHVEHEGNFVRRFSVNK
jgi:hypothetical protein